MKSFMKGAAPILAILCVGLSLSAQDSSRTFNSEGAGDVPRASSSAPHSGLYVSGGFGSTTQPGISASTENPSGTVGSGSATYISSLQGTSFSSLEAYYNSYIYFTYLLRQFDMDPLYFNRFYRNSEPLVTPLMLKLTLNEPLRLSSQMLSAIDRLTELLADASSGGPANKNQLVARTEEIRRLAKQIRRNQTVSYMELRKDRAIYIEEDGIASLSPESLSKLRDMATDLNQQLKTLYQQSSTSTVSVSHFSEASLESLTKGIEKLSKAIQNSSKRL